MLMHLAPLAVLAAYQNESSTLYGGHVETELVGAKASLHLLSLVQLPPRRNSSGVTSGNQVLEVMIALILWRVRERLWGADIHGSTNQTEAMGTA
jgi:hypothetical protein